VLVDAAPRFRRLLPGRHDDRREETEYLLRNPSNAAALRRSIAELEWGDAGERELIDPTAVQ